MTYPLYLLHTVFDTTILRRLIDAGAAPYAALPIALGSDIALAWLVSAIIEPGVRRKLRRWLTDMEIAMRKQPAGLFVSGGEIKTPHDRAPALAP